MASTVAAKLESLLDLLVTDLVEDRERYFDADGTQWELIDAPGRRPADH